MTQTIKAGAIISNTIKTPTTTTAKETVSTISSAVVSGKVSNTITSTSNLITSKENEITLSHVDANGIQYWVKGQ